MRRWWIASTALLAACATSTGAVETEITTAPTPVPTVAGVGSLPGTIPATSPPATEPLVVITRPLNADGDEAELIGDQVGGNRLLMIGDSIFAGTENRYGGEMCAGLEPLGWAVEVAAEAGRFVEFGVKVVNRNVPEPESESESESATTEGDPVPAGDDDWDAAAVFLGSNYNGDQENYDSQMREILDRLAPRPTLLYTVTEYRSNYVEVNDVIDDLVSDYPNVTLIDWAEAAETPGVLRSDGLHPNDAGEQVLVDLTAAALGDAPEGEADCIRSRFRDDSAIKDGSGSPNTNGSGGSSSSGSSSGGGSSSSSSGGSSSSSGGTSSGSGGSSSTGGGTDGTDTDGSGTDGTDTDGTGTDGTDTDGTGTDGSDTDGSGTDGSGTDGSGTDGSGTDGSSSDGSSSDGSSSDGSGTDGSGTDGSGTDGSGTDGSATDGGSTGTADSSGGSSDGSATTDGSATDAGGSDTGTP